MEKFLRATEVMDWERPAVLAKARELAGEGRDVEGVVRRCFEWVRDEIKHTGDWRLSPVTCAASEVLAVGSGFCYAKSHLLAALLRATGIATGLCYQRLSIGPKSKVQSPKSKVRGRETRAQQGVAREGGSSRRGVGGLDEEVESELSRSHWRHASGTRRDASGTRGERFCLHGLNAVWLAGTGWYRIDPRGNRAGIDAQFAPPIEHLAFSVSREGEVDFPEVWADPLPVVVEALMSNESAQDMRLPDVEVWGRGSGFRLRV